jgi:hypothetical protein
MRIVAKIPYKAISSKDIEEMNKLYAQGFVLQFVFDPKNEVVLLVV